MMPDRTTVRRALFSTSILGAVLAAGSILQAQAKPTGPATAAAHPVGEEYTTPAGLKITDLPRDDPPAKAGDTVQVHYTGKLTDGTVFDTSLNRGAPFEFVLGGGRVIKGWDEGIVGMRVGDKRRLVIPPDLAYGPNGQGPIPANATLVFDVQLVWIRRG